MSDLPNLLAGLVCRRLVTGEGPELRDLLRFWGFPAEQALHIHMCLQEPECTVDFSTHYSEKYFLQRWNVWRDIYWTARVAQTNKETHLHQLVPNSIVHGGWRILLRYSPDTRPWFDMFRLKCAQLTLLLPTEPEVVFYEACQQTVQPILAHITKLAEQGICVMDYDMHNIMCKWQSRQLNTLPTKLVLHIRWAPESFTALNLDLESVEVNGTQYCLPERLMMLPSIYASHMFLQFSAAFLRAVPKVFPTIKARRLRDMFEEIVEVSIPTLHRRMHMMRFPFAMEAKERTSKEIQDIKDIRVGLGRYEEILQRAKTDVEFYERGFIPWFPKHWCILESPDIHERLLETWTKTTQRYAYMTETRKARRTSGATFIPNYLLRKNLRTLMSTWPVIDEAPVALNTDGHARLSPELRLLFDSCEVEVEENRPIGMSVQIGLNVLLCEDTLQPRFPLPFFVPPVGFSVSSAPLLASELVRIGQLTQTEVDQTKALEFHGCDGDLVLCNMNRRHWGPGGVEERKEEKEGSERLAPSQSCFLFALAS